MDDFFNEIKVIKVLKKDELNELLILAQKGNVEARNKVIKHNLRLVLYQVHRFLNTSYDKEDLFQIGIFGLMKVVDTFNLDKNFTFSTYASKCINNEILMFLRKGEKILKEVSFNEPVNCKEGSELVLEDVLADDSKELDEDIILKELIIEVRKKVELLDGLEKEIIKLYFGFYDNKCYSQQEIADMLGFSRSYVSRLKHKAFAKLNIVFKDPTQVIKKEEPSINKKRGKGVNPMPKKLKTIYEYFDMYEKELIDSVINSLTEEEKYLLSLRYGDDLNNPKTSPLWNEEYYNKFYGALIPKIRRELEIANIEFQKNRITEPISHKKENISNDAIEQISDSESLTNEEYLSVLELLKTPSFYKLLENLSIKEAIIVSLKLGYVDGKYFSTESIANFLEIDELEVIDITKKVLLLYKTTFTEFLDNAINVLTTNPDDLTLKCKLN